MYKQIIAKSFDLYSMKWQRLRSIAQHTRTHRMRPTVRAVISPSPRGASTGLTGFEEMGARGATGTLLIEEVKSVDGVEVFIRLEALEGNRRRISGGLLIDAPPRAVWEVLTNYSALSEYIPNIAESGARVQPDGRVRIEQVRGRGPAPPLACRLQLA